MATAPTGKRSAGGQVAWGVVLVRLQRHRRPRRRSRILIAFLGAPETRPRGTKNAAGPVAKIAKIASMLLPLLLPPLPMKTASRGAPETLRIGRRNAAGLVALDAMNATTPILALWRMVVSEIGSLVNVKVVSDSKRKGLSSAETFHANS